MIVQNEVNEIQRSGISGERKFGISMNAKMYDMMSAKLYQDRIGSVTREVCSNAWDGMKMRSMAEGAPLQPFKITLPTNLLPHFVVEDFGVGMPDEQAQDLYSTLGLSTKENSNHQIGAFGLGSKSPFAVTDTFTVENTYEGITHYYLCFKNESGLPSLLKTGQKVEDDRVNGVKVIIPAPYSKFDEYVAAVNRQLFAMEPKPIVTNGRGFSFTTPKKLGENVDGYILVNNNEYNLYTRGIYGKMGMVIYPIDANSANLGYNRKLHNSLRDGCVVLNFEIGDLDPLPSREGLTYDKRTIANIQDKYDLFAESYKETLKAEVLAIPLPLDAFNRVNELYTNIGLDMRGEVQIKGFTLTNKFFKDYFPTFSRTFVHVTPEHIKPAFTRYNGVVEPEVITPEKRTNKTVTEDKFVYSGYGYRDQRLNTVKDVRKINELMTYEFANGIIKGDNLIMLYDEIDPKYRVGRLKEVLGRMSYNGNTYFIHVNDFSADDKVDFTELLAKFEAFHPGITKKFIKLSDIAKPAVTKTTFVKDSTTYIDGIRIMKPGYSKYESSVCLDDMQEFVELTEAAVKASKDYDLTPFENNALYIKCKRNDVEDYEGVELATFKNFCSSNNIFLFIARKGGVGQIKWLEQNGVLEFSTFMDEKMKNVVVTDDYKKIASARRIVKSNSCYSFKSRGSHSSVYSYLLEELSLSGDYIHPALIQHADILRLADQKDKATIDDNTKLLVILKDSGMMDLFKDKYPWAGNLDIDMLDDWNKVRQDFNNVYPAVQLVANGSNTWNEDKEYSISEKALQYVKDYNKLMGKVAVHPATLIPAAPVVIEETNTAVAVTSI